MNKAGFIVGSAFGFLIAGSGLNQYDAIHNALLFRDLYLYLMMGSAILTAAPILWLMRRNRFRTLAGEPVTITRAPVERHHVMGGIVFGSGWAIAGTCPAPVLAMTVGGGILGIFVMVGLVAGAALRNYVTDRNPLPLASPERVC